MNFDAECQAAMDLAKSALPEGQNLDIDLILGALYYATDLRTRLPDLSKILRKPEPCRTITSAVKVHLVEPLIPVMRDLGEPGAVVTAAALLRALLTSDYGRNYLAGRGMNAADIEAVTKALAPAGGTSAETPGGWRDSAERRQAVEALSAFGRMLTDKGVSHGGMAEKEASMRGLIRVLCQRKKRNAIVVGLPGTGKSALVYELASRLAQGHPSIPAMLQGADIFEMSPTFLRAGASVIGQFEERMKHLLQVLQANPRIILFIDEIHTFFQSAVYAKGPFSEAGDMLKGALARGDITCIGCTTTAEYRHNIEPDGALARRFTLVTIEPPSPSATLEILRARLPKVQKYYATVRIPEAILDRVVALTEDYLPGRYQPDKSIQLLDGACAFAVTSDPPVAELQESHLWQALEDTIGHHVARARELTEAGVCKELQARIIGQDDALRGIARAFVAGMGSWKQATGPRGVFLFGGPTGVGKTETALALSRILGGDQDNLVRVDCNTLQGSSHDSGPAHNRLLGVPPGYLGYARGQGGILTRIRDFPESIVLFDEFEKAPHGVGQLLLQILDTGRVEDVDGNVLDFRRSFIIFTTNAGCVYERQRRVGYVENPDTTVAMPEAREDLLKHELIASGLGQEFLGRIEHIFLFRGLDAGSIHPIVERQIARLESMARERGLEFLWDPHLVDHLASQWQPQFGVRHLSTILMHRVAEQLSIAEAQGDLRGAKVIRLEVMKPGQIPPSLNVTGLAACERQKDRLVVYLA